MIVVDKRNNKSTIIDFAIPYDGRIEDKERGKIEKYQDIAREFKIIWDMLHLEKKLEVFIRF